MQSIQFHTLSKSDFKSARECPAKLYYREKRYPTTKDDDPYLRMLAVGGYMVEAIAKMLHPGGLYLEYGGNVQEDAAKTLAALQAENVTLFEATLLSGNKLARVDILEKKGNKVRLIEVKSRSFDSTENIARILEKKGNCFRGKRKPFAITPDWLPYIEDVAFQTMLLREIIPNAQVTPFLALVDKSKRISVDELPRYFRVERREGSNGSSQVHKVHFDGDAETLRNDGMIAEIDVSAEVDEVMENVCQQAAIFAASLESEPTKLHAEPGLHCAACEYRSLGLMQPDGFSECWGELGAASPSVLDLYSASSVGGRDTPYLNEMIRQGNASLLDIPENQLGKKNGELGVIGERQLIQLRHTRDNTVWHSPDLRHSLESVQYPIHFIDFEACRLAIPPHAKMRAYGQLAFQWSCHTVSAPGATPVHAEWLNDREFWPNGEFARSLRRQVGDTGTVLTWSSFEGSVLKAVSDELQIFSEYDPELSAWIADLVGSGRILDMNKLTLSGFFHPGMRGRTSIKVVLDAIWKSDEAMRVRFEQVAGRTGDPEKGPYAALPPLEINGVLQEVAEGTGAIRAYEAMMFGVERDDHATRDQWKELLLRYCHLDTLAMVLIWEYWERLTGSSLANK